MTIPEAHEAEETREHGHFIPHVITKRDARGEVVKTRTIYEPDTEARDAHGNMLEYFYERHFIHDWKYQESTFVAGGMPGSELLDNVRPHANSISFYQLDLKDAFPSVDIDLLKEKFIAHDSMPLLRWYINELLEEPGRGEKPEGHPQPDSSVRAIWKFIDEYGTIPGVEGLPLGAPCSPYLFNFYLQDMDRELDAYCAQYGLIYTRWFDDITISSPLADGVLGERMRATIREIIERYSGMAINHAKSKVHQKVRKPVIVTGVALYPDGRIEPSPALLDKANEVFYQAHAYFSDRKWDITVEDPKVTKLLNQVGGYHSALSAMTAEPHGKEVHEAFEFAKAIKEMAGWSIQLTGLTDTETEKNHTKERIERDASALLRYRLGAIEDESLLKLVDVLGTSFPNMSHGACIVFAEMLEKQFPEDALEETRSAYEYHYDEQGQPQTKEARVWNPDRENRQYHEIWQRMFAETVENIRQSTGELINPHLYWKVRHELGLD